MQASLNFGSKYAISGLPMATIYLVATLAGAALALVVAIRMALILAGVCPPTVSSRPHRPISPYEPMIL